MVVIPAQEHIVASSVVRRHASEFIPGFVTFVGYSSALSGIVRAALPAGQLHILSLMVYE